MSAFIDKRKIIDLKKIGYEFSLNTPINQNLEISSFKFLLDEMDVKL